MNLTTQQIATLKALAAADSTAAGYMTAGDDIALAAWFNAPTAFVVWRSRVDAPELRDAVMQGAADLDNLSVGKRDSLLWICSDSISPANPAHRQALQDVTIKTGGTPAALLRPPLDSTLRRAATRLEQALASGTGTTQSPGLLGVEGTITFAEASLIRS